MMNNQLRLIIDGGHVQRYHTVPTHTRETVGHHSYTVAWIAALIAETPSADLLMAALQHDIAEVETGDIPAPFKRAVEGLRGQFNDYESGVLERHGLPDYGACLSEAEALVLKLSDSIAGLVLCVHEKKLGNKHVDTAYANFMRYTAFLMAPTEFTEAMERARQIIVTLVDQWEAL